MINRRHFLTALPALPLGLYLRRGRPKVLTFGEGTYVLNEPYYLENTLFQGAGKGRTILQVPGNITAFTFGAGPIAVRDLSVYSGYEGQTETGSVNAVEMNGVSKVEFHDVEVRRRGIASNVQALWAEGTITDSVRFSYCNFINEIAGIQGVGARVGNNPAQATSPIFDQCTFQGSPGGAGAEGLSINGRSKARFYGGLAIGGAGGTQTYGLMVGGQASPEFRDFTAEAGDGPYANINGANLASGSAPSFYDSVFRGSPNLAASPSHGAFCEYGTKASFTGCAMHPGVGHQSAGFYTSLGSSPLLTSCRIEPEPYGAYWTYRPDNQGRFQPFGDAGYQILGAMLHVMVDNPDVTLSLGTSPGAGDIALGLPIEATGTIEVPLEQRALTAGAYLYATPSQYIPENSFRIYYQVYRYAGTLFGIINNTAGHARFVSCVVRSPLTGTPMQVFGPALTNPKWRESGCFYERVGE